MTAQNGRPGRVVDSVDVVGVACLGEGPHRTWMALLSICFSADRFTCEVSFTHLSRLIQLSPDVARTSVRKLITAGFLTILDPGGQGRARRYRLNLVRLEA